MENWQEIKQKVYHEDGSLRDIYVNDTTIEDWRKWIDFVNLNYEVKSSLFDYKLSTQNVFDGIDFKNVENFLSRTDEDTSFIATIVIDGIHLGCYFFSENILEVTLEATTVLSFEHHKKVLEYLVRVSKLLDKTVTLNEEEENIPEGILIEVNGENVKYHF